MTELSYIECTASSLAALSHYRQIHGDLPSGKIATACTRAVDLLRKSQREDGSWPGFWGINYTYAFFHVAKGFRMAGIPADDPALVRGARWILGKQRPDGSWSEHYSSCLEERYIEHPESQAVMTSWALLGLMETMPVREPAIERGIRWLLERQLPNGGWTRQAVNGVFFGAAMLDYRLYHTYFPVWALTRYNCLANET